MLIVHYLLVLAEKISDWKFKLYHLIVFPGIGESNPAQKELENQIQIIFG